MSLTPGTRIGPYEILAKLGEGGMGEVYRARDAKLNRDVALKVLPASVAGDPDRLARFHREAQVLGALNHPNIAHIYGFEMTPGVISGAGSEMTPGVISPALVMELVEGPTLAEIIHGAPGLQPRGGPGSKDPGLQGSIGPGLPVPEALAIARQIADALEAAHEQGIIHRDLKPANIKVRDDGTVKVLDFGLAKAMDPTSSSGPDVMNSPTLTARATQLGMILGTAAYMAPEQAKGKSVDRRADIWAFGVVLFEMLAGQRAFKGEDVSDVLAAVLRQEVDWSALPSSTPATLKRVLERCLERDPKKRLRDIGDVWMDMDAPEAPAAAAPTAATAPAPSAPARWLPWALLVLVAGASAAWMLLGTPPVERRLVTRSTEDATDTRIFVAVSHDGSRLAYTAVGDSQGIAGITLRMLNQFQGQTVPGTSGGAFPSFSPDGQWLAYQEISSGAIKKIPITGGTSIKLCDGNLQNGAAWGDDNTIVFSGSKGLMRVSADGGTPEALTTIDEARGERAHIRPQFLPGGRQLLFTVVSKDGQHFAVRDLDKDGYQIVASGGDNGRYVQSGHLTYLRGATVFAVPFDVRSLKVTGSEVPVVESVSTLGPTGTADYAVSDNGLLVYFSEDRTKGTTLAWSDRTGTRKVLPGQSEQKWGTGRLSPDGRFVANAIQKPDGSSDIWTLDVERGTLTRLTFAGTNDLPIWTPDSRGVVYQGVVDGKNGLYVVRADASTTATLIIATDTPATPSSFSSDGRTLLYDQVVDGRRQIFALAMSASGQAAKPHPLHENAASSESTAQVSPDDKWVAYQSAESGAQDIYVQPFPGPGPKARVSLNSGNYPRWSRDGRELYFWANVPNASLMAVDVATSPGFQAGEPHELFRQLSTTTWDVTPDRNRFLVELSSRQAGSRLAIVTNWFEELRQRVTAKK